MDRFQGQVQLVLYPMALNPSSEVATQTAWCAGEQGKFWEFHHLLYERQEQWSRLSDPLDRLVDFAAPLGIDTQALRRCVHSGRMKSLIAEDKEYGRSLGVRSTPTLFINQQRIVGAQPEGDIVRVIRQEIERVQGQSR